MILPDVNVLLYALRGEAEHHAEYRAWLDTSLKSGVTILLADTVVSGVVRIATHPRVWEIPTPIDAVLAYVDGLRSRVNVRPAPGGPEHWQVFAALCRSTRARGNIIPDAWLAALAIEEGATLFTADRDFARFPGLKWRHPLDSAAGRS